MPRRTSAASTAKSGPVELFVSYAHENSPWFGKLRPLLKFRNPGANVAHVWHDQKLEAGHRWHDEIRAALKQMDVFVCLVSFEFLASDYIMDVELKEALRREKKKEVEIVPLLLYPINLDNDCPELKPFNPLPAWGKCWRDFEQNGANTRTLTNLSAMAFGKRSTEFGGAADRDHVGTMWCKKDSGRMLTLFKGSLVA